MKFRKMISVFTVGFILASFTGCADKETYNIKFNPSVGDEYSVTSSIKIDATQGTKKITLDGDVKGNVKYINVSEDEITEEVGYDDFSMNMDMGGISMQVNEDNEMFKELISQLKASKILITADRDGNILTYNVEGEEEAELNKYGVDLSSKGNILGGNNFCILENMEIKDGEEISISLDKLLGKDAENTLGVNVDGSTLIGKVKSIKDNVAEITFDIDSIKLDTNNSTLKNFNANIKINVDTGITESMEIDTDMDGSVQGNIILKSTMKKK
ncbi:putative secreted protein [Clostridium bornimense]|uniref:Putative secreted protein n=1 Tax=Clostridium bornimense TaxID=1216932 RepID=W6RYJ4_9CLOT|nr:hypothetical protein [Clostridium bornimense]CDM69731.1 putative secreted protein [Clostridium bornimense]